MTVLLQLIADNAGWVYAFCALIALWQLRIVLRAQRERRQSVFALEREAAFQRVVNALGIALALLVTMGGTYFIGNVLLEVVRPLVEESTVPTPVLVLPTLETPATELTPTATPTPLATPTPFVKPTLRPLPTPVPEEPTATPAPAIVAPDCPNPGARLTSPGQGQNVGGAIVVMGTANLPNMQYYKLEFRPVGSSGDFTYLTGRNAPADGALGVWDTSPLPPGAYTLRLVVVDHTGNYPPPCEVTVNVVR